MRRRPDSPYDFHNVPELVAISSQALMRRSAGENAVACVVARIRDEGEVGELPDGLREPVLLTPGTQRPRFGGIEGERKRI